MDEYTLCIISIRCIVLVVVDVLGGTCGTGVKKTC